MGDFGGQAYALCRPVRRDRRHLLCSMDCHRATVAAHTDADCHYAHLRISGGRHVGWPAGHRCARLAALRSERAASSLGERVTRPMINAAAAITALRPYDVRTSAKYGRLFSLLALLGAGAALAASG